MTFFCYSAGTRAGGVTDRQPAICYSRAMAEGAALITTTPDNRDEDDYPGKIRAVADALRSWSGPVVIVSHKDPDGDAVGSGLTLSRALRELGKEVSLVLDPPRFLRFLAGPREYATELDELPADALLAVLDVDVSDRAVGAPVDGAAFTVNLDHHGTNPRKGDLVCVEPSRAATAQLVKDVVDALGVPWSPELATPCLAGILTDTGMFRFGNTTPEVLAAAGDLIGYGIDYVALTDRLQLRHPDYFRLLGKVMATVEFPLGGLVGVARYTQAMRAEIGESEDDSDDFVGLIRYAEGIKIAVLLKERGPNEVKVSVRTRDGLSAQAICMKLGGGGHVPAAGATVEADIETARRLVLEAAQAELARAGVSA